MHDTVDGPKEVIAVKDLLEFEFVTQQHLGLMVEELLSLKVVIGWVLVLLLSSVPVLEDILDPENC